MHAVVLSLSRSAWPAAHSVHVLMESPERETHTVPPAQGLHGVLALASWSIWPASHSVHVVVPIPVYMPAPHTAQPVLLSMSRSARPAGQSTQALMLSAVRASQYRPAAQAVHGVAVFMSLST